MPGNGVSRCLVMTADSIPVATISAERAAVLVMQGKAYVIKANEDLHFRSKHLDIPIPEIIGIKKYVKLPGHFYSGARLTVNHLLRRDNWTCQYCGRTRSKLKKKEFLTRDHIFPVSRGGEDRWENVVIACNTCNNIKGDRTPDEAGMPLLKMPTVPTRWQLNKRYLRTLEEMVT